MPAASKSPRRFRAIARGLMLYLLALGAACNFSDPVDSGDTGTTDTTGDARCDGWIVRADGSEVCDGADNDCDGTVDENCSCPYGGTSDGVCSEGTRGPQGDCRAPENWESDEQSCDGVDNDCDGTVDENCSCPYGGTSDGVCSEGTRGPQGDCRAPENWESDEQSCDGVDNDCDGATDEGCACEYRKKTTGVCTGLTRSKDGTCPEPEKFEAQEVSCDQVDNDCDGATDEDCSCTPGDVANCYGGPKGTANVGICRPGTRECKSDGTWRDCTDDVRPDSEQCGDRKDNDCDGAKNENCPCNYKGETKGVCATARRDESGSCEQPKEYQSSESLCGDGADNDCDGRTDFEDLDCKRTAGGKCSADRECISNICDDGECGHRIFVTAEKTKGDFGGISAADTICRNAASDANLNGTWRAIVSVQGDPANERLRITGPVFNMTGQKFANDETSFWSGSHPNAPSFDANKNAVDSSTWSGTTFRGASTSNNCQDWTTASSNEKGAIGWTEATDNAWIHAGGLAEPCDRRFRLYCIDGQ